MRRYAATDPLFVGACEPTVAVTCYGHMATSSTTIPVDGRTNRILSLPFTYFNPCSPSMAARLSGRFNKQLPKARSVSDAPQLNSAAAAASVQRVRDLWKQVFVSKKQDRPEQSCYPIPSNSGSFGQRGLNAGVGRRGTTRAAPFSFICCFAGAATGEISRRPDHGLVARASGRRVARTDHLAQWLGPLFRQVCCQEGCC